MAYLADTHMHSIYSYDGQMCLEDMVKKGLQLGLQYMAFTEHLEFGQISLKQFLNRFSVYYEEVERLQEKYPTITLLKGVEFTNPELYPKELESIQTLPLDYIIGSNHAYKDIQSEKDLLLYYQRILSMVKQGGIDSLGHMDYVRRKIDDSGIEEDVFKEIFSYLIRQSIALEINSSARRRKGLDSFPSKEKLTLFQNMGGSKVTIGSDAHRLNEIYDSIADIDSTYAFQKGLYLKRKFISLSEED